MVFNQLPVGWNNAYWHKNNQRFLKTETKEWKSLIALAFEGAWDKSLNYGMEIFIQIGDKRKRDIDGGIKFIMDALTGVVYNDDSQMLEVHLFKSWGKQHETTISLYTL
jgi:Holliday junction resolvase RusA-like endonuclease